MGFQEHPCRCVSVISWLVLTCLQLLAWVELATCQASTKPNILLIVSDDYGWNDVGYHGSQIATPNIDALAGGGVKLENYYVQPICSPTRSQLLTGRYQIHTGLQHGIIWNVQPNGIPLSMPTIADKMKDAGYSTHMVGKWHVGFYKKEYMPLYRGFDSHFGYLTGAENYYTHSRCGEFPGRPEFSKFCGLDLRSNMAVANNESGVYSTHLFTRKVEQIVADHDKTKPLFVYLPYQAVHAPLQVPKEYEKPYQHIKNQPRRTYAGMVSCMDEGIGNITEALKKNGMWNNTVIIFSTDNGGQVHTGGNNYPLRGWKTQLWEGGIRGVGFVSSPLLKNKGTKSTGLMHVSDWFPTILHLSGSSGTVSGLDGYNQWPTISEGQASPRKEILHNIDSLFTPKGKSLYPGIFDTRVRAAIRYGDWKLITGDPGNGTWVPPPGEEDNALRFLPHYHDEDKVNLWLFNLRDDPNEHNNVVQSNPDMVKFLLERLRSYNSTAVPARYPPPDTRANPALLGGAWGPWEE